MKPYEEIDFPNGFLRWIREDGVYSCTLTEEQMIKIKALHEAPRPWVGLTDGEVDKMILLMGLGMGGKAILYFPLVLLTLPLVEILLIDLCFHLSFFFTIGSANTAVGSALGREDNRLSRFSTSFSLRCIS